MAGNVYVIVAEFIRAFFKREIRFGAGAGQGRAKEVESLVGGADYILVEGEGALCVRDGNIVDVLRSKRRQRITVLLLGSAACLGIRRRSFGRKSRVSPGCGPGIRSRRGIGGRLCGPAGAAAQPERSIAAPARPDKSCFLSFFISCDPPLFHIEHQAAGLRAYQAGFGDCLDIQNI